MIKTDRQLKAAYGQLKKFQNDIANFNADQAIASGIDPAIVELHLQSLMVSVKEFENEISHYRLLRDNPGASFVISSLAELPGVLVSARIAQGWTQRELAEKMNLKEQQIQRYEAEDYHGASLERLCAVIDALGLGFRAKVTPPRSEAAAAMKGQDLSLGSPHSDITPAARHFKSDEIVDVSGVEEDEGPEKVWASATRGK